MIIEQPITTAVPANRGLRKAMLFSLDSHQIVSKRTAWLKQTKTSEGLEVTLRVESLVCSERRTFAKVRDYLRMRLVYVVDMRFRSTKADVGRTEKPQAIRERSFRDHRPLPKYL